MTVPSDTGPPLLLMLHGRGGNETDLQWIADDVSAPWSPQLLRGPLSRGQGYEWFHSNEKLPGPKSDDVRPAADRLLHWIDDTAVGRRVAVLGYSQGGAVALQMLRRAPGRLDFVITLAGFTTIDAETGDAELARRRPPVFWGRGARDDVIPPDDIERMSEFLPRHVDIDRRVYEDADHWISTQMAADAHRFIRLNTTGHKEPTHPGR